MTYSSSLTLGRQRYAGRNQNTTTVKANERSLGPISNTVLLIILACLLGLLYLTQVTKTNAFSYRINTLQQKQQVLSDEHTSLEITSARLQALERIKDSSVAKSMVSVVPSKTLQD